MEVKRLQSDLGDRPDKTAIADAAIAMMQARASGATAAEQAAACVDAYIATMAREQNEQHRRELEED